jgi:hypothetical protein
MAVVVATMQLLAIAALIFGTVVLSWRAGERYWSSRP